MTRIAYVILCSCLLAAVGFIAQPASAGDREDGAYDVHLTYRPHHARGPHYARRIWYTSTCCYLKIVRHAYGRRQVRFMRVRDTDHPTAGYEREKLRRHADRHAEEDVPLPHRRHCNRHRVRVFGADGKAVWALTARCYR